MKFKEVLLNFRAKHNLSQNQLSQIIGVSVEMIYRYETEKSKPWQKNKIMIENKMKDWEENKNVKM